MTPKPRVNLKTGEKHTPPEEGPVPEEVVEEVEAIDAYVDADDEFGSEVSEESEVRGVIKDLSGGKGISGATDLTPHQAVLLTQWRVLMHNYPDAKFGLGLGTFPEWFELYRLSINRGSRKENTEILRGNVALKPPPTELGPPGSRW